MDVIIQELIYLVPSILCLMSKDVKGWQCLSAIATVVPFYLIKMMLIWNFTNKFITFQFIFKFSLQIKMKNYCIWVFSMDPSPVFIPQLCSVRIWDKETLYLEGNLSLFLKTCRGNFCKIIKIGSRSLRSRNEIPRGFFCIQLVTINKCENNPFSEIKTNILKLFIFLYSFKLFSSCKFYGFVNGLFVILLELIIKVV